MELVRTIVFLIIALATMHALGAAHALAESRLKVVDVGEAADPKQVEFRGVAAGAFDPAMWEAGTLHLPADIRRPLIEPRPGKFRNIYAPSIVQVDHIWRIYYGAWDGVPTGNDRIYLTETADFLTFGERRTVIEHGEFHHVCNVNVIPAEPRGYAMVCTVYPDENGLNKPAVFFSEDGLHFNGAAEAFPATREQIVKIDGYEKFQGADINGMNVLLREQGKYRLYFGNFRDFGKTFRASSDDGKNFTFDGSVLDGHVAVNDVKKFRVGPDDWYLMGLHMNGERIFYTLSRDGMKFPPARTLAMHHDAADRYIVAAGFVTSGEQDAPGRRVLGVLYGAGAAGSLDQNRIFARWLQKKVTLETGNETLEPAGARGPDRQVFALEREVTARLELRAEDGQTRIAPAERVTLSPGRAYAVTVSAGE